MATAPNSENQPLRDENTTGEALPPDGRYGENDARLIMRVANGDHLAFTVIYDRYARVVYSVALRVVRDAAVAEDILHDIFLALWRSPRQFDSARGSLAPWLAVIARNRSIDWLRREHPREELSEVLLASDADLATEIERDLTVQKIRGVLNALPEKQRHALELAFFTGLTHQEIAAQSGEPLGTIKTRIRSALTSIRKALER